MNKWIGLAARIPTGAIFLILGANGLTWLFFGKPFIEMPPPEEGSFAAQYFTVLAGSYLLKTIKIVEVLGAIMLLSGIFLPLGVVILAPIIINIFLFHLTIQPADMGMAIFLVVAEGAMVWAYWDHFKSLFRIHKGL